MFLYTTLFKSLHHIKTLHLREKEKVRMNSTAHCPYRRCSRSGDVDDINMQPNSVVILRQNVEMITAELETRRTWY